MTCRRCRDGAVVRALVSHQRGPGLTPTLGVICGLSLLVLYSAPRGFSPGEGVVSKETVVLRRWGSSIQKFGFINGVDNVNWPPYRDSKS